MSTGTPLYNEKVTTEPAATSRSTPSSRGGHQLSTKRKLQTSPTDPEPQHKRAKLTRIDNNLPKNRPYTRIKPLGSKQNVNGQRTSEKMLVGKVFTHIEQEPCETAHGEEGITNETYNTNIIPIPGQQALDLKTQKIVCGEPATAYNIGQCREMHTLGDAGACVPTGSSCTKLTASDEHTHLNHNMSWKQQHVASVAQERLGNDSIKEHACSKTHLNR